MKLKFIKNHSTNRCEQRDEKKETNGRSGGMRAGPKGYHFKRFPSEENREESQQKGANKVECKKWSAKGTYRKASADREPTTHLNTLGGQRPRADSLNAARGRNTAAPERMLPCECGCGLWSVHGECGYLQCKSFASSSLVFCEFFARALRSN